MACVWACIVSGAAQARTAAPTPPFGRTRILAILRRAGKVSLVGLLPQSGHESDTRHRGDDNCCKSQQQCMTILFLRHGPLLPHASVLALPSIATDRVQFARNTQGDRDGNECGSFDEAHDKAASATGNGAARRQHDLWMELRGEFPRRFALSPRCVVWDLSEVEAWLASRRSASIARAQHPDVTQRRLRPVRELGRVQAAASKAV
jgi:predicted DNA-binding transcriptional regulator AlpA